MFVETVCFLQGHVERPGAENDRPERLGRARGARLFGVGRGGTARESKERTRWKPVLRQEGEERNWRQNRRRERQKGALERQTRGQ